MDQKDSRRARELLTALAERFDLSEAQARAAVVAVASAIEDRLPRGVRAAFLSWMPQSWSLLRPELSGAKSPIRGVNELKERVVAAGVPGDCALPFVAEMVRFLAERCGRPLAEALRRKIPEIASIEQQTAALVGPSTVR